MKKIIYIILLIVSSQYLKAQFTAVLTKDSLMLLQNDVVVLAPDTNLRGTVQWQKTTDLITWTDINVNSTADILVFTPTLNETYRIQITEGTCKPIIGDTAKVFGPDATFSEYESAGVSITDLLDAKAPLADLLLAGTPVSALLTAGASVSDLFVAGAPVSELYDAGVNVSDLLTAGASIQDILDAGAPIKDLMDAGIIDSELYGKEYVGGLIFYIDLADTTGFVAAPTDQSYAAGWGCSGTLIGTSSTSIGMGAQHTIDIVAGCVSTSIAAYICDNLSLGGYSDWFLPSRDELNKMYTNLFLNDVGAFGSGSYWSSSEDSFLSNSAWRLYFSDGTMSSTLKSNDYRVRAARAF